MFQCIAPKYREADLQKGEAVCIDRCVAKYLDVHERIGWDTNSSCRLRLIYYYREEADRDLHAGPGVPEQDCWGRGALRGRGQ